MPLTPARPPVLIAAVALAVAATPLVAQPPGPPRAPTYSPYLNLLRSGTPPAVNYYGLVRPEQNLRQALQGVQSAVSANQRTLADLTSGNLPTTGVTAQFLNHGGFFQNQLSGGGFGVGSQGVGGSFGGGSRSAAGANTTTGRR